MIVVIKEGKIPKLKYHGMCDNCQTTVKCDSDDIIKKEVTWCKNLYYIVCPLCKEKITNLTKRLDD